MKKYKKLILYTASSVISISIITYTFFALLSVNEVNIINKNEIEVQNENDYKYVVKEVLGKINVFEKGKKTPTIVTEKSTEYLPEYDQKMLKDGIYLYSKKELNKILQDYDY